MSSAHDGSKHMTTKNIHIEGCQRRAACFLSFQGSVLCEV